MTNPSQLPIHFLTHGRSTGPCGYCGKDKAGFIVTCAKGTLTAVLICDRDFARLSEVRSKQEGPVPPPQGINVVP